MFKSTFLLIYLIHVILDLLWPKWKRVIFFWVFFLQVFVKLFVLVVSLINLLFNQLLQFLLHLFTITAIPVIKPQDQIEQLYLKNMQIFSGILIVRVECWWSEFELNFHFCYRLFIC